NFPAGPKPPAGMNPPKGTNMELDPIRRDQNGLAQTSFCQETANGGLNITFSKDTLPYQLGPESLADASSFAETWHHLTQKAWFTPEVATDVVNVVTAAGSP